METCSFQGGSFVVPIKLSSNPRFVFPTKMWLNTIHCDLKLRDLDLCGASHILRVQILANTKPKMISEIAGKEPVVDVGQAKYISCRSLMEYSCNW